MKKVTIKIDGMHCTSCAMNIDFELEDLGVKSQTNYAKSETKVEFDSKKITFEQIINSIEKVGYKVKLTN